MITMTSNCVAVTRLTSAHVEEGRPPHRDCRTKRRANQNRSTPVSQPAQIIHVSDDDESSDESASGVERSNQNRDPVVHKVDPGHVGGTYSSQVETQLYIPLMIASSGSTGSIESEQNSTPRSNEQRYTVEDNSSKSTKRRRLFQDPIATDYEPDNSCAGDNASVASSATVVHYSEMAQQSHKQDAPCAPDERISRVKQLLMKAGLPEYTTEVSSNDLSRPDQTPPRPRMSSTPITDAVSLAGQHKAASGKTTALPPPCDKMIQPVQAESPPQHGFARPSEFFKREQNHDDKMWVYKHAHNKMHKITPAQRTAALRVRREYAQGRRHETPLGSTEIFKLCTTAAEQGKYRCVNGVRTVSSS